MELKKIISTMELKKILGAILVSLLILVAIDVLVDEFIYAERAESSVSPAPDGGAPEPAEVQEAAAETAPAAEAEPVTEAEPAAEAPAASGIIALVAAADVAAGQKIARKCVACHTVTAGGANRVGPNLWDIVGADLASREGYKYSSALSGMGGTWSLENLDAFLTKPKTFVPGTKMSFAGVKSEADRAALIAYLRSLSDNPVPLP